MSYLLDKKIKRKKYFYTAFFVFICLVAFYFQSNIFNGLSFLSQVVFRPVLVFGNNIGEKLRNAGSYFASKNSLYLENKNLKSQISESEVDRANYASVVAENVGLKEILGRKDIKAVMVLSAILSKPNQSAYDTLIIDVGAMEKINIGNTVFALGNIPIGRISNIYPNSSKVILFSNVGEETQAVIDGKNIFVKLVGRGGGNFEMIMPKDFVLQKGDQAILPGIYSYVLAIVEMIISDPRDPLVKALLVSPVNIQELKFVEVLKN